MDKLNGDRFLSKEPPCRSQKLFNETKVIIFSIQTRNEEEQTRNKYVLTAKSIQQSRKLLSLSAKNIEKVFLEIWSNLLKSQVNPHLNNDCLQRFLHRIPTQQTHDVASTSVRRLYDVGDVVQTLKRRRVSSGDEHWYENCKSYK